MVIITNNATTTNYTTAADTSVTTATAAITAKSDADNTKLAANAANTNSSDSSINFNIKKRTDDTLLSFTSSKINQADNLTLNSDNLAYIEYTGQEYEFMDDKQALYVNTSLDYNANITLK
ncbi:hypothetical protein UT300005_34680 [Clostridium sp. CTA-5]